MTARYATDDEITRWDQLILANPDGGNIFSGTEYAAIKRLTGYRARFIMADDIAVTILEKSAWPLGRLWYLPKGPNVTDADALLKVIAAIRPLAHNKQVFAIRTETELPAAVATETVITAGLVKANPIIPNASTIIMPIGQSLDDLLNALPQKGRYAIRRAERDGVTVDRIPATVENCHLMYKLLQETAAGQFGIRKYDYFQTFWQTFEASGRGQLFFAYYDGAVVAGAYAMVFGKKSTYKDGASSRQRSAYGASHLLQWEVIKWAKQEGAIVHDLCGSPPLRSLNDPTHPHYRIGLFKTAFSKNVIDYIGCYDQIVRPARYRAWLSIGERIYRKLYYLVRHDYYY